METKEKVAIVIPIYKSTLTKGEEYSLQRCQKILKDFPIIFLAPKNLNAIYTKNFQVEEFDKQYFEGIQGYNRFMLSTELYQRFEQYEYILVYQLDALVLSNQLLYWCNQNLDYIGAAWVGPKRDFISAIKHTIKVKNYENSLKGTQVMHRELRLDLISFKKAGNGGFSLRKVNTLKHITEKYSTWIEKIIDAHIPEDTFFAILLNLYQPKTLKVGSFRQGLRFAFEMNPSRAFRLNWWRLPFGCHDFEDWEPDFWQNVLSKLED
jgi:hypothetical protein